MFTYIKCCWKTCFVFALHLSTKYRRSFSSIPAPILGIWKKITDLNISDLNILDLNILDLNILDLNILDLNILDLNILDLNISDLNISDLNISDLESWILDLKLYHLNPLLFSGFVVDLRRDSLYSFNIFNRIFYFLSYKDAHPISNELGTKFD